jgi:hypothetical protein
MVVLGLFMAGFLASGGLIKRRAIRRPLGFLGLLAAGVAAALAAVDLLGSPLTYRWVAAIPAAAAVVAAPGLWAVIRRPDLRVYARR